MKRHSFPPNSGYPERVAERHKTLALASEIATLAAHDHALSCRLLELIREFDERQGWGLKGCKSMAHWLHWRCGYSLRTAREKVRVAHALAKLPEVHAAFARGELSYAKVRAITRIGETCNEELLLMWARHGNASHVARIAGLWLKHGEEAPVLAQHRDRSFSRWEKDDGTVVLRFELPAEEAVVVLKALEAAAQEVVEEERAADASKEAEHRDGDQEGSNKENGPARPSSRTEDPVDVSEDGVWSASVREPFEKIAPADEKSGPAGPHLETVLEPGDDDGGSDMNGVRETDALIPEWNMENGPAGPFSENIAYEDGGGAWATSFSEKQRAWRAATDLGHGPAGPHEAPVPLSRQRLADGLVWMASRHLDGSTTPQGLAEKFLVHVHLDLRDGHHQPCCEPGTPGLSRETIKRLGCEAAVVGIVHGEDGEILSVGRKTRAIPTPIRRALRMRDGGCRFPGCTNHRWVDAHHIVHWEDGGETSLSNLVELCRYHHRLLHEGGCGLVRTHDGLLVFTDPHGYPIPGHPALPRLPEDPVGSLIHRQRELEIDERRCRSLWDGYPPDWDVAISGLDYWARKARMERTIPE